MQVIIIMMREMYIYIYIYILYTVYISQFALIGLLDSNIIYKIGQDSNIIYRILTAKTIVYQLCTIQHQLPSDAGLKSQILAEFHRMEG